MYEPGAWTQTRIGTGIGTRMTRIGRISISAEQKNPCKSITKDRERIFTDSFSVFQTKKFVFIFLICVICVLLTVEDKKKRLYVE